MVSNDEISIRLECKRVGLDPDELIKNGTDPEDVLQIMQVPYEWTESGCLFDFDSIPVEELSNYIDYMFKQKLYSLKEGNPIDGIYGKSDYMSAGWGSFSRVYKLKVEIYSSRGKTYLEISKVFRGWFMSADKIIYGKNYLDYELYRMVDKIKYLKPSSNGYLICNKCGSYYELQKGESPDSFDKNCECGGTLKYIAVNQPDKELVERKKTAHPTQYLRAPVALILVSLACISTISSVSGEVMTLGIIGLAFGMVLLLMRYRGIELVLDNILKRFFYLFLAIIFFVEGWGLISISLSIGNYSISMIEFSIFAIIAVIFGLGMIFKAFSPDNPRNLLDPPLWLNSKN